MAATSSDAKEDTSSAIGPDTSEETTFDRFKLNAKIDPKKFEVVK